MSIPIFRFSSTAQRTKLPRISNLVCSRFLFCFRGLPQFVSPFGVSLCSGEAGSNGTSPIRQHPLERIMTIHRLVNFGSVENSAERAVNTGDSAGGRIVEFSLPIRCINDRMYRTARGLFFGWLGLHVRRRSTAAESACQNLSSFVVSALANAVTARSRLRSPPSFAGIS